MLPAEIFGGCSSPGEREVFDRLKGSDGAADWIVLHSLDIAQHIRQVSGEADFVVIIPGRGVLCVEVKACRRLRRDNTGWFYGAETLPDVRGPFRQASEAMHSVRNWVLKRRPDLSRVLFWSAIVFPYVDFKLSSGEWHDWQVIDASRFRNVPLTVSLEAVLKNARTYISSGAAAHVSNADPPCPTSKEADEIAQILRPSFEVFESPKARQNRWTQQVRQYTEEQFSALDSMSLNDRVLFSGPAGTGKTLLAIEAARRAAAEGLRCLLLCFNRNLGRWLQDQTAPIGEGVRTATFHSFALSMIGGATSADGASASFWEDDLPNNAIEALLENEDFDQFDILVVDEAQDLLKSNYLDVLDLVLKRGLSAGKWCLFGDFEKQAIYTHASGRSIALLQERVEHFTRHSLRTNCRNAPRIAALTHLLGGLTPGYSRVLRPDIGIEPELKYFADTSQQESILLSVLDAWQREGITGDEVVILSPRSDKACLAARIAKEPWKSKLSPCHEARSGKIAYSSIHSFKGLEAGAVIVTDIEQIAGDMAADLFYVAITRALHRLTILVHDAAKSEVARLLTGLRELELR